MPRGRERALKQRNLKKQYLRDQSGKVLAIAIRFSPSSDKLPSRLPAGTRLPNGKVIVGGEDAEAEDVRVPIEVGRATLGNAVINRKSGAELEADRMMDAAKAKTAAKPKSGAEIEAEKLMAEAKAKQNSPSSKRSA